MDFMRNNQAQMRAGSETATYDAGLRQYMLGVYNYMTGGVALCAITAYIMAMILPMQLLMPVALLDFFAILIYALAIFPKMPTMTVKGAQATFWSFAVVLGVGSAYILHAYTGHAIIQAFLMTVSAFAGLSVVGYTTKKDLSAFGTFLIMGIVALIVGFVLNFLVFQSSALTMALMAVGVLIFAGLTAYDTQKVRQSYYQGGTQQMAIYGATMLFWDFVIMFKYIIALVGNRE